MGSATSSLDDSTSGYHILKVQENSPGYKAGLQAFFDFIISVADERLEEDNESIREVLTKFKDTPVPMQVYSSKTQTCREVMLTPSSDWGGQGLLGLSIRYCSFKGASENIWHILDVEPNSPASMAGLKPFTDYVIGTDALLNDVEDFFSVVEAHNGQPLRLYIYNSQLDTCRDATIIPNLSWGGEGMLGCEIGVGFLHRIPAGQEDVEKGENKRESDEKPMFPPKKTINVSPDGPNMPPPPYNQAIPSRQDPFELPQHLISASTGSPVSCEFSPMEPTSLPPPAPLPTNFFDMIPSSTAAAATTNSILPPPLQPGLDPHHPPVQAPQQVAPIQDSTQSSYAPQPLQTFFQPGTMDFSNAYAAGLPPIPLMPSTTNIALPGMPPISVTLPSFIPPPMATDQFHGQHPPTFRGFNQTESVNH